MVLIYGAKRRLFSPPSFKIDLVGLIYQADFSARELFFEFDAEPSSFFILASSARSISGAESLNLNGLAARQLNG